MLGTLKRIFSYQNDKQKSTTIEDDKSPEEPFMAATAFYIGVIFLIGLPMWFYTCSVTRYSIPDLGRLETKLTNSKLSLHLDISIIQLSRNEANDADNDRDETNDSISKYLRSHLPHHLKTNTENVTYDIDWRVRRPTNQESAVFKAHLTRDAIAGSAREVSLVDLESKLVSMHKNSNKFRIFMYLIREQDHPAFCDPYRVHSYTINSERFIYLCPSSAQSKPDDHSSIVSLITEAIEELYANTVDHQKVKLILDSKVDLLFTLLPESTLKDNLEQLFIIADKIHHLFERNVRQKYPELKGLINIRPITQNLLDLFENNSLERFMDTSTIDSKKNNTENDHPMTRVILVEKLVQLFHLFESRLSKHSAKNVHNVILLARETNSPRIEFKRTTGQSSGSINFLEGEDSRSMLIVNDDKSLVLGLRAIVRRLVGLRSPNICKSCLVRRDIFFCSWEIDAIMGTLTLMKLHDTYTSLRAISQQVMGIKIPKDVAAVVRESHNLALRSIEQLDARQTYEAHSLASRAYEMSEQAFYDPSLLESLYFPDDLKYAIYLPFFLPLAYPIILSILKLLKYSTAYLFGLSKENKVKMQ